jgi:hypothetical protein
MSFSVPNNADRSRGWERIAEAEMGDLFEK